MKLNLTKGILAGAALAGLLTGGALRANAAQSGKTTGDKAGVLADEKGETHSCKGKNSCKGKGGCAVKDGKPTHGK